MLDRPDLVNAEMSIERKFQPKPYIIASLNYLYLKSKEKTNDERTRYVRTNEVRYIYTNANEGNFLTVHYFYQVPACCQRIDFICAPYIRKLVNTDLYAWRPTGFRRR